MGAVWCALSLWGRLVIELGAQLCSVIILSTRVFLIRKSSWCQDGDEIKFRFTNNPEKHSFYFLSYIHDTGVTYIRMKKLNRRSFYKRGPWCCHNDYLLCNDHVNEGPLIISYWENNVVQLLVPWANGPSSVLIYLSAPQNFFLRFVVTRGFLLLLHLYWLSFSLSPVTVVCIKNKWLQTHQTHLSWPSISVWKTVYIHYTADGRLQRVGYWIYFSCKSMSQIFLFLFLFHLPLSISVVYSIMNRFCIYNMQHC